MQFTWFLFCTVGFEATLEQMVREQRAHLTEVMGTYFFITKLEVYLSMVKVNLSLSEGGGGVFLCNFQTLLY